MSEQKFCVNCKHYAAGGKCLRKSERNFVDGTLVSEVDCADERSNNHSWRCGEVARFFEQRPDYLCKDCRKVFEREGRECCVEAYKVYRNGGFDPRYADFTCAAMRLPGGQCGVTAMEFVAK